MPGVIDLAGHRIGRLLVLERHPENDPAGSARWLCRCACGTEKVIAARYLHRYEGRVLSCGCLRREKSALQVVRYFDPIRTKHGRHRDPLYRVWAGLKRRCENPRDRSFAYYGARGVTVCEAWRDDPLAFILWAQAQGWQPGLDLDRIDPEGPYSPENCRFLTAAENRSRQHRPKTRRRRRQEPATQA